MIRHQGCIYSSDDHVGSRKSMFVVAYGIPNIARPIGEQRGHKHLIWFIVGLFTSSNQLNLIAQRPVIRGKFQQPNWERFAMILALLVSRKIWLYQKNLACHRFVLCLVN